MTSKKIATQISVTLSTPIIKGDAELTIINLRKPNAGDLRGLHLAEVLQFGVDELNVLIPRISKEITERDLLNMDMGDYTNLCKETIAFFVNAQ